MNKFALLVALLASIGLTACSTPTISPVYPNSIAPGVVFPNNYKDAVGVLKSNGFILVEDSPQKVVATKDYNPPISFEIATPRGTSCSIIAKQQRVVASFYRGGNYFYREFKKAD
jgi:hypothetical protein